MNQEFQNFQVKLNNFQDKGNKCNNWDRIMKL